MCNLAGPSLQDMLFPWADLSARAGRRRHFPVLPKPPSPRWVDESREPYTVQPGERIAQLILLPVGLATVVEVS